MGILGIKNRTENWKTAEQFSPFFGEKQEAMRIRLAKRLLGKTEPEPVKAQLELFWNGMRDYVHPLGKGQEQSRIQDFAEGYNRLFPNLREQIEKFVKPRQLQTHNYCPSKKNDKEALYRNLLHTEIDIVLETPTHLFIGEAKDESHLSGVGKYVLVHQLIRQYVMAKLLVDRLASDGCPKKNVVPFVVGNKSSVKNSKQVKFMIGCCWLREENVLSWDDILKLQK